MIAGIDLEMYAVLGLDCLSQCIVNAMVFCWGRLSWDATIMSNVANIRHEGVIGHL